MEQSEEKTILIYLKNVAAITEKWRVIDSINILSSSRVLKTESSYFPAEMLLEYSSQYSRTHLALIETENTILFLLNVLKSWLHWQIRKL
jgi:hypothetical protein